MQAEDLETSEPEVEGGTGSANSEPASESKMPAHEDLTPKGESPPPHVDPDPVPLTKEQLEKIAAERAAKNPHEQMEKESGKASRGNMGDLNPLEIEAIQRVVDQAGRPLDVVGSTARGERSPTSDIDYVISPSSLPYFDGFENELPGTDPTHGLVPGFGDPQIGPFIRFYQTSDFNMTTLHRYWFEFDKIHRPTPLNIGIGVTAYDYNDAIAIIKNAIFGDNAPDVARCTENVDVSTLDPKHVLPNIGLVTKRGVWFPKGYE